MRLPPVFTQRGAPAGLLGGIHAAAFAAYPILFLWAENRGETSPEDVVQPFVIVVGLTAVAVLVLGLVLGDRRRGALLVAPIVLGGLLYGHVGELTKWSFDVRTGLWVGLSVLALAAAIFLGSGRLGTLDRGLRVLSAVLIAMPLVSIVPYEVEEATAAPPPVLVGGEVLATETDAPKRDVYWLVFDRYSSDLGYELQYGFQNDLTPWLRDQGFEVLDRSHANYVATSLSMATTLNMAHLEDLTGLRDSDSSSYNPVYARLQGSRVVKQFQALGYRYVHLGSWWNPTRTDEAADRNFNADGVNDFTAVLIEQSVVPAVVETFDLEEEPPTESVKQYKHNRYALDQLPKLPGERGPKFVLGHILLPHPPYVFDRDGRYIPEDEAAALGEAEGLRRQLDYTNSRIRAFITQLLSVPEDQRPIVIIQADEGHWPPGYFADKINFDWETATEAELETKFGILNAWYVPGGTDALALRPEQTAINTFPVLFSRYFGLDGYEELPDRVTTSHGWNRPYRLIDITDRLPSLR